MKHLWDRSPPIPYIAGNAYLLRYVGGFTYGEILRTLALVLLRSTGAYEHTLARTAVYNVISGVVSYARLWWIQNVGGPIGLIHLWDYIT